jgi:hypothetical protein
MEKVVRVFANPAEADAEDAKSDAQLTPEQRIQMVIQLRELQHPNAAQQGLARVCCVTELRED